MVLTSNGGGRYYIFMTEFMWTHLDPREEAKVGTRQQAQAAAAGQHLESRGCAWCRQVVTVMDVEGVGLKDLRGEALEFIRLASDLMQVRQTGRP